MKYLMMDFNVLFVLSFIISVVNKKFEEEDKENWIQMFMKRKEFLSLSPI